MVCGELEQPITVPAVGRVVNNVIFTTPVTDFAVPALWLSFIAFVMLVAEA